MKLFALILGLFCFSGLSQADTGSVVTGPQAQAIYENLTVPVRGPFCTGACFPGQPCDPTCTSFETGQGWECSKTEYKKSGRLVYRCQSSTE